MAAFEVGKTYTTRSACDHTCIISLTVISRTAKTITADCGHRGVKTLRIAVYDGYETVKPWGSYSMAPQISAYSAQVPKEPEPDLLTKVYSNDVQGVALFIKQQTTITSDISRIKADPLVEGVWRTDHENGDSFVVYLAGYKDPFGNVRPFNDFESC